MVKAKDKTVFLGTIKCPACGADINVFKKTVITAPSVPAEKEESLIVEHLKGRQATL
jgi:hypothetical protein